MPSLARETAVNIPLSLFWLQWHHPKMWYKKKNHFTLLTGSEGQGFNQGAARKGLGTGIIWNILVDVCLVPAVGSLAGWAGLQLSTRLHPCSPSI